MLLKVMTLCLLRIGRSITNYYYYYNHYIIIQQYCSAIHPIFCALQLITIDSKKLIDFYLHVIL